MITKQDFPTSNDRLPDGTKLDGTKFRVLIVDDSMFVAKQLTQILTTSYRVDQFLRGFLQ